MSEFISLRAYARRRGVALSAVQKAIESRRVTAIREDGGRITGIDPVEADRQWAANTDPVEAARNGKLGQAPIDAAVLAAAAAAVAASAVAATPASSGASSSTTGAAGEKPTESAPGGGDQGEYLAARAKREGFLAKQAELEYLEQIGTLVSSADVEREFSEIFVQLRSSVFRIADSKSQLLAAETDPLRVSRLLTDSFRAAFDELSRRFAADAAGGVEERAPALP